MDEYIAKPFDPQYLLNKIGLMAKKNVTA